MGLSNNDNITLITDKDNYLLKCFSRNWKMH